MLKNNLSVLMAERGLKIADLYNATGISKTTLMAIANNNSIGIQFETLDRLCNYLDVTPNDFLNMFLLCSHLVILNLKTLLMVTNSTVI